MCSKTIPMGLQRVSSINPETPPPPVEVELDCCGGLGDKPRCCWPGTPDMAALARC